MSTITITFPFASPSQNEIKPHFGSGGYWKQKKWRDHARIVIRQTLAAMRIKPTWAPRTPTSEKRRQTLFNQEQPHKVRAVFRRYSQGTLDKGNLIGGCKPILDALVLEGLIYDDSIEWLDDAYEQHKAKKGDKRLEVEVSDV
jgi:hypothetical protein